MTSTRCARCACALQGAWAQLSVLGLNAAPRAHRHATAARPVLIFMLRDLQLKAAEEATAKEAERLQKAPAEVRYRPAAWR